MQQGLGGGHQHIPAALGQLIEGRNPGVFPLTRDDGAGSDKELSRHELQNAPGRVGLPQQNGEIADQAVRFALIGTDHHQWPSRPLGHGGRRLGAVNAAKAGDGGGAAAALHGLGQGFYFWYRKKEV